MSIVNLEMQHCWSMAVSTKTTTKNYQLLVKEMCCCCQFVCFVCVHVCACVVCGVFLIVIIQYSNWDKICLFYVYKYGFTYFIFFTLLIIFLLYISIHLYDVFLKDKANSFASECGLFSKWMKCKVCKVFPGCVESQCVLSLLFHWTDLHKPRCLPCLLMSA